MTSTDSLLQPVSSENHAGDDLSASGALFELETMVVGKPETQFSQAEEADWGAVRDKCIEMLGTSKDLRVAVILTATLLKTEGFVGFSNGLAVVRGFLENYWDAFYPRLDPEDNNDPQERVNVLNNLAAPIATSGDPLCVLATLRKVPVTNSREAGNLGLGAILASRNDDPVIDGHEAPSAAMVDGAFRDTDREKLHAASQAVTDALSHIEAIDAHFSQTVVSPVTPSLGPIAEDLRAIRSAIAPYLVEATSDEPQMDDGRATDSNTEKTASRGGKLTGSITTREDAVRALDMIIAFYQRSEPSSPIPYLLGRVRRLVPMNFVDLIKDLTPEALEKFSILTGPLDNSE